MSKNICQPNFLFVQTQTLVSLTHTNFSSFCCAEIIQVAEWGEARGGDGDKNRSPDCAETADREPQSHGRAAYCSQTALQWPGGSGNLFLGIFESNDFFLFYKTQLMWYLDIWEKFEAPLFFCVFFKNLFTGNRGQAGPGESFVSVSKVPEGERCPAGVADYKWGSAPAEEQLWRHASWHWCWDCMG